MENSVKQLSNYFRVPEGAFWRWAADGVIEWENGKTICYRDDLLQVMRSLGDTGVPTLEAVLLAFAACSVDPGEPYPLNMILDKFATELATRSNGEEELDKSFFIQALNGLVKIGGLPPEWRTGHRRTHLFTEVFSLGKYVLTGQEVVTAIDEYNSLNPQSFSFTPRKKYSTRQFAADLKPFAAVSEKYADVKQLEQHLRTGLPAIPLPAPIELPEERKQGNLLQELLEEPRTTHISQLAKKMIAALHIPMHFQRSGGASYGGVSDITNRGNFDKLLLSELAADNTLLLTRLVHNEALYLRREEPPNNPKTRRLILLDTTLRLWGTPRVFAVSAAIACTQNLRPNESVEAYTLGGQSFTETDLATTEGVIQTMEQLDAALHCTDGLAACTNEVAASGQTDTILITGTEMITEPAFQKWLATAGEVLDFIITVNGSGELHFSSVSAGQLKQLSSAKIDLEEVLAEKKPGVKPNMQVVPLDGKPAFLALKETPLLFPAIRVRRFKENFHYFHQQIGFFTITETMRLLWWPTKEKGAKELLRSVESGKKAYRFNYDGANSISLTVFEQGSASIIIYYLHQQGSEMERWEVKLDEPLPDQYTTVSALQNNELYIGYYRSIETKSIAVIDCLNRKLKNYLPWKSCASIFQKPNHTLFNNGGSTITPNLPGMKSGQFINNGYTVPIRIHNMFIDENNCLCLNTFYFTEPDSKYNFITLKNGIKASKKPATRKSEEVPFISNEHLWLKQFSWNDGSTATVDSRGLLHLKSSDMNLPEVTLVLVQDKTSACWASDGAKCGSEYFRESIIGMMPVQIFYNKYITPFIQTILQKT